MKTQLLAFSLAALGAAHSAGAQQVALMPMPASAQRADGSLTVTPAQGLSRFTFRYGATPSPLLQAATVRMLSRLDRACGGDVRRSAFSGTPPANPTLEIDVAASGQPIQALGEDESYTLTVTPSAAKLTAPTDLGALHGMETLLQLASNENGACVLPAIAIQDAPRFPWRGFMLDVSRHFEPIPVILRMLDGMALAKLNVFHWHLSDDQGFRAESKLFPKLTSVGSGGEFYTQEQMREVVAYARARGIRVVPEFDIPGHASSWILAYPEYGSETITQLPTVFGIPVAELDPSREATFKFLNAFIGEMSAIFPDPYFHIGGDETEGKGWLANPRIVAFMQKKGFKTPAELQAYFNQRLLPILRKHSKRMIGWDEILNPALPKDIPKEILVQSWRGEASLAAGAKQGYEGILSAPYYLDAEKTSAQMFLADPVPAGTALNAEEQKRILGGEICQWAEQLNQETVDSRVWPRTLAVAERLWSPQSDRDVSYMYQRLRRASLGLQDLGLRHLAGPQVLRENLAGNTHPEALDTLASVTEPVSFSDRYEAQRTDALTSLDRLVDAVVADPPSRQEIAGDVEAVVGKTPAGPLLTKQDTSGDVPQGFAPRREDAVAALRTRFTRWQTATPALLALSAETPRLNDIGPRALQLGELGAIGTEALAYLEARKAPPAGWTDHAQAVMSEAGKGPALVHFTFLVSLQKLVAATGR